MTSLSSLFAAAVRELPAPDAPPLSDTEYLMRCTTCKTVTTWQLVEIVAGVPYYRCQNCGKLSR